MAYRLGSFATAWLVTFAACTSSAASTSDRVALQLRRHRREFRGVVRLERVLDTATVGRGRIALSIRDRAYRFPRSAGMTPIDP